MWAKLLPLFLLVSCTNIALDMAKIQAKLNAWKGHSKTELVSSWGSPDSETKIKDKFALTYAQQTMEVSQSPLPGDTNLFHDKNPHSYTTRCKITWIIDSNDKILYYSLDGNINECNSLIKDVL